MTEDEAFEFVKPHLAAIAEHFDAVQLLATWVEVGEDSVETTHTIGPGKGNWNARVHMAGDFSQADSDDNLSSKMARALARHIDPPDNAEDWKTPA